jgi:ubiquinone/menaquinone biosynthesis C-methylase UbiE
MRPAEAAAYWEANAETWTRHSRAGLDVYRDHLNTPAFLAMLPDVAGLDGLDLGCGEGTNTRRVAALGARMHAIDVSPTFIRHAAAAEAAHSLGVRYMLADAGTLPFDAASFDFTTAFMSLMDMPHHLDVLREVFRVLRPGGFLQFSILHPCFMTPHRRVLREPDGTTRAIEIGGYFDRSDGWMESWWFSAASPAERAAVAPFSTPCFDRTLSDWVNGVVAAGFAIERMGEPRADEALARAVPEVSDTLVAPLFLHVRARKPI